jgi:hypothetical protein
MDLLDEEEQMERPTKVKTSMLKEFNFSKSKTQLEFQKLR